MSFRRLPLCLAAAALCGGAGEVGSQSTQVVKPPMAQAWIDVATFGGFGMPMGMPAAGGGNPMAALGGLFGGGGGAAGANRFGQTQAQSAGRWVDVTLSTRQNPQLAEAEQRVPPGFLPPALKLQSPRETRGPAPDPADERPTDHEFERPKGRMLLYWGCGERVRAGQPRVVDFATASPAELGRFFQSRRATQRGTHAAAGRPVWPSPADTRMVPAQASLVGEHAFSGAGVPEGWRFQLGAAQDLMPAIALKQTEAGGSTLLEWQPLQHARAYFISAMGMRENNDMVVWTSSEQPDLGQGLLDYQTNPAVDRWLQEGVLLPPQSTRCAVPQGVFGGEGTMLRMIAYGHELNLAHPPRPADPRTPWEPVWAVKVRVKSVTMAMLGMESPQAEPGEPAQRPGQEPPKEDKKPGVKDVLRGIFGR